MERSFSLEYYDRIFGQRGPQFWELVSALAEELQTYADDVGRALSAADEGAFARLRHSYRPVALNLELKNLRALEIEIAQAFAQNEPPPQLQVLSQRFRDEAQDVARALNQIRYA